MVRLNSILLLLLACTFCFAQTGGGVSYKQHTVQAGETMFGLASRVYKIDLEELRKANPQVRKDEIKLGQVLKIPIPTQQKSAPEKHKPEVIPSATESAPIDSNWIIHTVEKGDQYYSIALKYGITPKELMEVNDVSADPVPGQQVFVPVKSVKTETQTSQTETVPEKPLAPALSEPSTDKPAPKSPSTTTVPASQKPEKQPSEELPMAEGDSMSSENWTTYIVEEGDKFHNIAIKYGITLAELLYANDAEVAAQDAPIPGQQLRVPVKPVKTETPPVQTEVVPDKPLAPAFPKASVAEPTTQRPASTAAPATHKKEDLPVAQEVKPVAPQVSGVVIEKPEETMAPPAKKTDTEPVDMEKKAEPVKEPLPAATTSVPAAQKQESEPPAQITYQEVKTETKTVVQTTVTQVEKTDIPSKKEEKKKPTASIYDPHINGTEARNFPSRLGEGFEKGAFNLIDLHASVSNTSISYASIRDMIFGDVLTDVQAGSVISQMKSRNNFFAEVNYQSLNIAFKVRRKKQELFSMELGHRERVTANLQYNKNLFKLLLQGNKQFAGDNVALGPVCGNALYVREFPLGVSVPINIKSTNHAVQLRPAIRAKFLMGIGNVYTEKGNASMYTDAEGKYIDFDFDYLVNYSIPNSLRGLLGTGNLGWGTDFGLGINLDQNLSFDIGLIDLGAVRFKNNVRNYSRTGVYRHEGAEAQLFTGDEGEKGIGFSLNEEVFNPVKTENAYTTPLGTKITFRAEYRFGMSSWGIKRDSTRRYFQHHVYLNYIQGLQNAYSATTTPAFSVGYMYSLKNVLNLGINMGFLGYNKFSIGPFLSVKAGVFVIGFGSDNLMPFIAPKAGTGVDAYFNLGFVF